MKNYDPYKRMILFFASIINILLMSAVFAWVWHRYYNETMYTVRFFRRGNYLMVAVFAVLLFFFSNTYGGLKIGQNRLSEILLSQYLSLSLTNLMEYLIITLLAFRPVNPLMLIISLLAEMAVATVWDILIVRGYNRIFQPWKILLVYGERPVIDLLYKVESRNDKYVIYDAINIDAGMEQIAEKIKRFQAVIIGDISAVERNDLLKYCYMHKIRAYVIPKISDIILMGADRIHVFDTPFLLSKGYALSFDQCFFKRVMDIVLSIFLLALSWPVMLVTAVCIKLDDGGPVFYHQTRCSRDGKPFEIYKFRSMVVDAERGGAVLAKEGDDRITAVGKTIRSLRIDELPQLFNILKGDMSFVGPRPERPEIMEEYCAEMPEFMFRTRVKAGLTGYAQVYGKYNTTPYDKLKLDLFYIENYSFWADCKLILMTVKTILKKSATEGIAEGQTTARKNADGELSPATVEEVRAVLQQMKSNENG